MFQPVVDADVPTIVELMNRAYRGSRSTAWSNEAAYLEGDRASPELLREEIAATPEGHFLKWLDPGDDVVRGCVWLAPVSDATWYLGSLAVDPDQQKGGLGKTLLAHAERWVNDRGGRQVRMTVINVREELIAWYLRRGYVATGETAPFPYGDDRFGRPLRDDLEFVVLEKALPIAR